jgi:hypothetical protein
MILDENYDQVKKDIKERIETDKKILDELRIEIQPLKNCTRRIQERRATSVSLVGTDGGNNYVQFDPFMLQFIRVVDSSNNSYCFDVISPTTNIYELSAKLLNDTDNPLGILMKYLNVPDLTQLSPMIRPNAGDGYPKSPSWVRVYRELAEWATLFKLVTTKDYGTDTLLVFDGLLRSKVFAGDKFNKYLTGLNESILQHEHRNHRKLLLVGLARHSKVLDRYRLAMALENVLTTEYPAYCVVPREIERKAYIWSEYARGNDMETGGEINKFVGGKMFLVKFGSKPHDPIWPIDIFEPQEEIAQNTLGCLLTDAVNGFPVPFYPQCLQKAHENAALVDLDFDFLQDQIFNCLRDTLKKEAPILDEYHLQKTDVSDARY